LGSFRLALISMPWPLANRPSIQLGTLKSFLKVKAPDVQVDCYHFYLGVADLLGLRPYNAIAAHIWVAESIYGYLLNPANRSEIMDLVKAEHKSKELQLDLETVSSQIYHFHQRVLVSPDWSSYDLIGFSMSLSQLTSSLYMIRQIRDRYPNSRIVVGGASCAGELGRSLLTHISQIDFVVNGEGELPLLEIIKKECNSGPNHLMISISSSSTFLSQIRKDFTLSSCPPAREIIR